MASFSQLIQNNANVKMAPISNAKIIYNGEECGAVLFRGADDPPPPPPSESSWISNFTLYNKTAIMGNPTDFPTDDFSPYFWCEFDDYFIHSSRVDTGNYDSGEGWSEGEAVAIGNFAIGNAGILKYRYRDDEKKRRYCVFIAGKNVYSEEGYDVVCPILFTFPFGFGVLTLKRVLYQGYYTSLYYYDKLYTFTKYGDSKGDWVHNLDGLKYTEGNGTAMPFDFFAAKTFFGVSFSLYSSGTGESVGSFILDSDTIEETNIPTRTINLHESFPDAGTLYKEVPQKYTYIGNDSLTVFSLDSLGRSYIASVIVPVLKFKEYIPGYVLTDFESGREFVTWYEGGTVDPSWVIKHYTIVNPSYLNPKCYWRPETDSFISKLSEDILKNVRNWVFNPIQFSYKDTELLSDPLIGFNAYAEVIDFNVFKNYTKNFILISLKPGFTQDKYFSDEGFYLIQTSDSSYQIQYFREGMWYADSFNNLFSTQPDRLIDFFGANSIPNINNYIISKKINIYDNKNEDPVIIYLIYYDSESSVSIYKITIDISKLYNDDWRKEGFGGHFYIYLPTDYHIEKNCYKQERYRLKESYPYHYPFIDKTYNFTTSALDRRTSNQYCIMRTTINDLNPPLNTCATIEAILDYKEEMIYPYGGHYLFLPKNFSFSNYQPSTDPMHPDDYDITQDYYDMEQIVIDLDDIQNSLNYHYNPGG